MCVWRLGNITIYHLSTSGGVHPSLDFLYLSGRFHPQFPQYNSGLTGGFHIKKALPQFEHIFFGTTLYITNLYYIKFMQQII